MPEQAQGKKAIEHQLSTYRELWFHLERVYFAVMHLPQRLLEEDLAGNFATTCTAKTRNTDYDERERQWFRDNLDTQEQVSDRYNHDSRDVKQLFPVLQDLAHQMIKELAVIFLSCDNEDSQKHCNRSITYLNSLSDRAGEFLKQVEAREAWIREERAKLWRQLWNAMFSGVLIAAVALFCWTTWPWHVERTNESWPRSTLSEQVLHQWQRCFPRFDLDPRGRQ